ncbi:toxin VasX [Stutzerimonas stutzeri]|uniref:toxin VasX n=1 Tax=Stutzerimonas stutzeri TaxID=316 RepID=UPI003D006A0D
MTAQTTAPASLTVAACPLLSAVLPLRYALGPTLAVDTTAYDLPALRGNFPAIGDYFEPLQGRPLNYTARLLRDGWLYVWQSTLQQLVEYRVSQATFSQTARGGRVIDGRSLPYLLLPAGTPAMLVWSPQQWADASFAAAKNKAEVRQRVMRTITPGAAPFSGQARTIHERIGDYMDANWYGWSCEPSTSHRPAWPQLLDDMQRCEQQSYALIDDPWGVLLDLAELLRARQQAFNVTREVRGEDWAMAGVLKSLAESDSQIGGQLHSMTNYRKLQTAWQEQTQEEDAYSADVRRLSELWSAWFNTLAKQGPASLDTACGHFDVTQPAARAGLELHFAAACLGPAGTSVGAKTLTRALTPGQQPGKPWLLWALLGSVKRMGIGDIKTLVDVSDGVNDSAAAMGKEAANVARALALSTMINRAADQLSTHNPAPVVEALFTALAPAAGASLHTAHTTLSNAGRIYLAASLARSQQRLAIGEASPRQMGEWLSDLMGTRPKTPPKKFALTPVAGAVKSALPFFHLVPAPAATQTASKLTPLTGYLASDINLKDMLSLSKDGLSKAPIKCLVALVAGVNFGWSGKQFIDSASAKNFFSMVGGAFGILSAGSAVLQKVAEVNWESVTKIAGKESLSSQVALSRALGMGAKSAILQSVTSGLDVAIYGIETLEAFRAGDFDTAAINSGLSVASATNLAIYVKTYRVVRAARAAVIAGDAAAVGRGVAQAPHLAFKALGITILIVGGVIARLYTQDSPLEKWIKGTRFGISPAEWANNYQQSLTELYKILFPIYFDAYRLNELNPYHGMQEITYLILRLPGKAVLSDDMLHFKGEEVWGGLFGFGSLRKPVEWTGKDFDLHAGTRVSTESGVATYRRVYHQDREGRDLNKISGKLSYSPMEGLTLPAIDIEDIAWL